MSSSGRTEKKDWSMSGEGGAKQRSRLAVVDLDETLAAGLRPIDTAAGTFVAVSTTKGSKPSV